jgi:hypothetical protein
MGRSWVELVGGEGLKRRNIGVSRSVENYTNMSASCDVSPNAGREA